MSFRFASLAAVSLLSIGVFSVPAGAVTWEYSNNGKGNHYLMAAAGKFFATFACNGTKVIAFFSVPLSEVGTELEQAKTVFTVTRIDGDATGNGNYAWFSTTAKADKGELTVYLPDGKPVIGLLRDLHKSEREFSFNLTTDNPAKGRFRAAHAYTFDADGADSGVSELFEACKIK
jgi:hypothetical protein